MKHFYYSNVHSLIIVCSYERASTFKGEVILFLTYCHDLIVATTVISSMMVINLSRSCRIKISYRNMTNNLQVIKYRTCNYISISKVMRTVSFLQEDKEIEMKLPNSNYFHVKRKLSANFISYYYTDHVRCVILFTRDLTLRSPDHELLTHYPTTINC